MNRVLYIPLAAVVAFIQALPLTVVAILGRSVGHVAWWLDWRHRRIALVNLDIAFGEEKSRAERYQIAHENFRRMGEAFFCALKTSVMRREDLRTRLQVVGISKIRRWLEDPEVPGIVVATGHFGNVEMYGEAARMLSWVQPLAVYRKTSHPLINRVLQEVRKPSPAMFFDEATEMNGLRQTIREGNVVLGLMADCNPGPDGVRIPFFEAPASTAIAPLVHAHRHGMPLFCAACFRTGLGRWRVELSDQIETRVERRPRSRAELLSEMNSNFETAIRRDPANWYWVHRRWEHEGRSPRQKGKVRDE